MRLTDMGGGARSRHEAGRAGAAPLVLALTSVAFFMVALDALVVVTALPAIHSPSAARSARWSGPSTPTPHLRGRDHHRRGAR